MQKFNGWQRQAARIAHERKVMKLLLGGRCAYCGVDDDLQFDHVDEEKHYKWHREKDGRRRGPLTRHKMLVRHLVQGELQLLCRSCNSSKADGRITKEMMQFKLGLRGTPF